MSGGNEEAPIDPPKKDIEPPPDAVIKDPQVGPGTPPTIKEPNAPASGPNKDGE